MIEILESVFSFRTSDPEVRIFTLPIRRPSWCREAILWEYWRKNLFFLIQRCSADSLSLRRVLVSSWNMALSMAIICQTLSGLRRCVVGMDSSSKLTGWHSEHCGRRIAKLGLQCLSPTSYSTKLNFYTGPRARDGLGASYLHCLKLHISHNSPLKWLQYTVVLSWSWLHVPTCLHCPRPTYLFCWAIMQILKFHFANSAQIKVSLPDL